MVVSLQLNVIFGERFKGEVVVAGHLLMYARAV